MATNINRWCNFVIGNKQLILWDLVNTKCLTLGCFEIALHNLECSVAGIDRGVLKYFQKINFYSCEILDDDYFDRRFLRQVVKRGLNSALHSLHRNTKEKYFRRLTKHEIFSVDLQHLGFKRGLASVSFLDMGQIAEAAA